MFVFKSQWSQNKISPSKQGCASWAPPCSNIVANPDFPVFQADLKVTFRP